VARTRRQGSGGRHLSAVPDPQPALWQAEELARLAQLRKLALDTDAPAEAIRLLETAATADEAVTRLTEAGLMPTEQESLDGLLSWFAPLLEPGRDQLDAEVAGSQFIAELRRIAPAGLDVLADVAGQLTDHGSPEALAMMRVLAAIGPDEVRLLAANAARGMALRGQADLPWARDLGRPRPGHCFGYQDIYGEQRSVVITFSYGRKKHALVVLIDYLLGGGIKDCYAVDYAESLRTDYRSISSDPELRFSDLDGAAARALLEAALSREPCPVAPDQIRDVEDYIELLRARVALLPGGADRPPARRAVARNIHRLKVTLRDTKPPIWRRFEVPSDISLHRLHTVIQLGFGWQDYHLFVFETPVGRYGDYDPDLDIRSAAKKKLSAVADWPGDRIRYEYDFGDSWEHDIVVEAVQPAEPGVAYPRCVAGRRACPPEDCGGVSGYYEMVSTLADPRRADHAELLRWLGIESAADFDPAKFDLGAAELEVSAIARILVKA